MCRLVVTSATLAVALCIVVPAASAKKRPPPPPPPPPPVSLVFTPNLIYPYTTYTVTGCGYPLSTPLTLELVDSGLGNPYPRYFSIFSDASGCLTWAPPYTGTLLFQAEAAGSTDEFTVWEGQNILAHAIASVVAYP